MARCCSVSSKSMTATDSARAFGGQSARKRVLRRLLGDACWRHPVSALEGAHRGRGDRTELAVDVADGKTQLREIGLQLPTRPPIDPLAREPSSTLVAKYI
jgi:hypothetical protein